MRLFTQYWKYFISILGAPPVLKPLVLLHLVALLGLSILRVLEQLLPLFHGHRRVREVHQLVLPALLVIAVDLGLEESLILDFLLLLAEGVRVKLELLEGVVVDEEGDAEDLRGKLVRVAVRFGEAVALVGHVAAGA